MCHVAVDVSYTNLKSNRDLNLVVSHKEVQVKLTLGMHRNFILVLYTSLREYLRISSASSIS